MELCQTGRVGRATELGHTSVLHHVRVPIEIAIERAAHRTDMSSHRLSADDVRHLAGLFEPPTDTEGFTLRLE